MSLDPTAIWDIAVAGNEVVELSDELVKPDDGVDTAPRGEAHPELQSLPLVVRSEHDAAIFSSDREVWSDEQVLAIGLPLAATVGATHREEEVVQ